MSDGNSTRMSAGGIYKRAKPDPHVMMAAFDRLPAQVRRAIAGGADDYEVLEIAERVAAGMPERAVLAAIERMDARIYAAARERFAA